MPPKVTRIAEEYLPENELLPTTPQERSPVVTPVGRWDKRARVPKVTDDRPFDTPEIEQALQISKDLDTAMRVSRGDLGWALKNTRGINPDDAARVKELTDKLRIDPGTVQRNLGTVEEIQRENEILNLLAETNKEGDLRFPYTVAWLLDPENMAKAKDDVEGMAAMEGLMKAYTRPWSEYYGSRVKRGAKSLLRSGVSILQAYHELGEGVVEKTDNSILKVGLRAAKSPSPLGFVLNYMLEERGGEDRRENISRGLEMIKESDFLRLDPIPDIGGVKGFAGDFFEMTPQLAGTIGVSALATPVAGAAFIGSHIFGTTYEDLRGRGVEPERAAVAAFGNSAVQSGLEFVGLNQLFKLFKATGGKQIALNFLKTLVVESGTEALQAFPESAALIWGEAEKEGQSLEEQVELFWERAPDTFKQGLYEGLVVAPVAVLGGSAKLVHEYAKVKQLQNDQRFHETILGLAEQSKLKERDPDGYEAYVEQVIKDSEAPSAIYMPFEKIEEFFQEDELGLNNFIRETGIGDQIEGAKESSGDVEVPYAKWVAKFAGTDLGASVKDDIRFDIDGLTVKEQLDLKEQTLNTLKELNSEYETLLDENRMPERALQMREQLIKPKDEGGFGLTAADADIQMSVFLAGARVLSQKRGETLQAWFDRVNPTLVIGGKPLSVENLQAIQEAREEFNQEGEKTVRGSIQFTDTKTIINLFEKANLSTLAHETGHLLSIEMKKIIDEGLGDDQLKKDYQALIDFAGGTDKDSFEKIARAFEAYLLEGKAPSVGLTNAFRRFSKWLTSIYKNIRGLGVQIDPGVREVFSRLLASEEEIREVQDYYKAKTDLVNLVPLTQKQKDKLSSKKEKAASVLLEEQVKQHMTAYLKAVGGKQVLAAEAEKQINADPVYNAIDTAVAVGGINLQGLKESFGQATINELKKHTNLVKKKGKASLGELAAKYDFPSEEALLDALLRAERKTDAVKNRLAELLAKRETEITEELRREEAVPGEEAIHNDAQLSFLIAEAEVLSEKIEKQKRKQGQKLEARIFKDAAEEIIARKKVSAATRYDLFAKSEQKFARQAFDAVQSGDLAAAFEAKRKQILNHTLVQAAIKARDEKNKIENRYKASVIAGRLKNVENDYAEIVLDLIHRYGLSTSPAIKPKKADSVKKLTELDELLAAQTPEWIISRQLPEGFDSWRDLTMQQFRELDEAIRSIMHYGRDTLNAMKDEGIQTLQEFIDKAKIPLEALKDKAIFNEFSVKGKVLNSIEGLLARTQMTEFLFERLDNYEFTKTKQFGIHRRLFNKLVDAETNHAQLKGNAIAQALPHWDVLQKARKRLENKFGGKAFDIDKVPLSPLMQEAGRFQWNVERMAAFVLNLGNASNLESIRNAYGYSDEQINKVVSQFTNEELDAIQGIWDTTETLFPLIDEVNFNIYNRHLDKVDAQPLTVTRPDGSSYTLNGGYYPLQFDHILNDVVGDRKEEDIMKNRNAGMLRSTKPKDGFTFSRKPGHSLPPELGLNVWFSHINDVTRYISHAEISRDLNRITQNPEWSSLVRKKEGRLIVRTKSGRAKELGVYPLIRRWVQFQARPDRRLDSLWDNFLEKQRRLATIAILGANLSVGVKQRLSMTSAAKEIGWNWIIEGYKQMDMSGSVLGLKNSDMWQKAINLSTYLKTRMGGGFDRELQDALAKIDPFIRKFEIAGKQFTMKDVQDFMFVWIQMNDRATVGVVWFGAFNKYLSENKGEDIQKAVKFADAIVRTTQPSSLPVDLNALQRSEGMMRLFTSFMTWTFKYGNRVQFNIKAYREGAIDTKEYARHILYENLMSPWGAMVISSLLIGGKLPEWWEWLTAPVENAVSWIPFIRDIPGAQRFNREIGSSPAFEGLQRIVKAGDTTWGLLEGDKELYQVLWDVGRAVELQAGVPALQVVKQIKRIIDNVENATK